MTKYLLTAAVAALFATPALADPVHTGFRAEGRLGYDRLTLKASADGDSIKGHDTGVTLGGEVGFDGKLGSSAIVGGYATVDFASIKQCGELLGDDNLCATASRNMHLGVRAGVAAGHALFYAKGGYSRGRFGLSYYDGFDEVGGHDHRGGWHLGAGAEINLSDKSYLKLEYLRTNYRALNASEDGFDVSLDGHRDQIVFGVGLRL